MRVDEPPRAGPAETEVSAVEPSPRPEAAMPERIGPYRVESLLGRGGMGEVYRAWDPRLERPVAVKRILAHEASPKARARFWREARVLAALSHENLVALHDIGEENGQLYIAMELIEGRPLSAARSARWPIPEAVELVRQVAEAVGAAHTKEIVHRDIKPSNILIDGEGRPRLIDFGLARRVDEDEVTQAGGIVGTWTWMAPEQIAGEPIGPWTDVHALGGLLVALLIGQAPYQRESKEATAAAITTGARPDLRAMRPDVPASLAKILESALERDPKRRPAHGRSLAESLERWLASEGVAPDREALGRAFSLAQAAIVDPGIPTGLATKSRVGRRSYRVAAFVAVAIALALGALVWFASGSEPEAQVMGEVATSRFMREVEVLRADTEAGGLALEALRAKPRKALVVLPFRGGEGQGHRLGGVLAELLREDLGSVGGFVVMPWRAMLARSDEPPEALTAASWSSDERVDGVLGGVISEEGGDLTVTLEIALAGREPTAIARFVLRSPESALPSAVRALVMRVGEELGVAVELTALPRGGASPRASTGAIAKLLEAERALHAEHWRAFRALIQEALALDPELPRARIHQAVLDIAIEKSERARETLRALIADDIGERDRGVAKILIQRFERGQVELPELLERHLVRFPADLDMRLELLRERFRAAAKGKLSMAITLAEAILADTPRATQAASKLARSLAWTEGVEATTRRLSALGVTRVPGVSRVTDFVFAELALYAGRVDEAREEFAQIRESDGDMTFYAAHMQIIAEMLGGRCDEAYDAVLKQLRGARSPEGALGVDWTYLLGVHALLCADRVDEAYEMAFAWPERLGPTPGASAYRYLVHGVDALRSPTPERIAEVLLAERDGAHVMGADWLVMQYGRDVEAIRELVRAHRVDLSREGTSYSVDLRLRTMRGLEARARFLEGDIEGALDQFASLALDASVAMREGDLYERTRWRAVYAQHLEDAGQLGLAREHWQSVLDSGFGKTLVMDVVWLARAALGRLTVP